MKKKIFAGAMIMLCSTLALAGCNAKPTMQGEFKQKEYILSLSDNEGKNFLEELKVKGIQKKDITIKSSSSEIIEKTDEGIFVPKTSGSAIIEAQINGKTIASCKVVVKYKMASPKNFVFSNGILSWDKSFVGVEDQNVYADEYLISYQEIVREGEQALSGSATLSSNQFSFESLGYGAYSVQVCAGMKEENKNSKYIEPSTTSTFSFVYGNTSEITNFIIEQSEDYNKESATLVWNKVENCKYDVYLNRIKIASDLENESFVLDYSSSSNTKVEEGGQIEVKIVAKDKDGLLNPSEVTKTISRLKKPSISYVNDNSEKSNGHIFVTKDNDNDECVYIIMDKDGKEIDRQSSLSPTLAGYTDGLYKIRAYTKGEGKLNSAPTEIVSFAKLSIPTFDVDIEGQVLNISFEENQYVNRYKILIDGNERIITLAEGENTYSFDISPYNLSKGDHTMQIIALPRLDGEEITQITLGGDKTANILSSNAGEYTFKVLNSFGAITHRIENDINQFKFEKIDGATNYIIEVNGEVLSEQKFSVDNSGDKTIISIPNLKNINPNESNEYVFKFTAIRKEGEKVTGIETKATKSLKILGLVSESTSQTNGSFTFNKVSQSDTYYYEIFSTGEDFTLSSGATPIRQETIYSGNKTKGTLSGGYYKIRIYTKSTDEDNYLDADFVDPSRYFEANFSVTQKLDTPSITYDRTSNSLNIQRVQFGGGYEIYVDGNKNGALDLVDDDMAGVYKFSANTFKNAKTYSITVKAIGGTKYGDELYEDSSFASLTITKLATPTFSVSENFNSSGMKTGETLTVSDSRNAKNLVKAVEYYINGEKLDEGDYSIELFRPQLGSSFEFEVKYIARDDGLNEYYIDSEKKSKAFERIESPKNMEYSDGYITFVGCDLAQDYYAMLYVINDDEVSYYKGLSLGITSTTIDLQGRLNLLMQSSSAFASILENADRLEIELYAKANDPRGEDETYLLPSYNGYTTSGAQKIVIGKLSESALSFDKASLTLSWTETEEGSTYDVYANNNIILSGLTSLSTTLNNSSLSGLNYLNGVTLKVKSNNGKYLDSKFSNEIYIKKLSTASEMTISTQGEGTIILTDYSNTLKVLNDGVEMNYSVGGTSVTKILSGNETLKIRFVGKDSGNRYYLDSDEGVFNVEVIGTPSLTKDGNIISWQDLSDGQNGISDDVIIYTLIIENGEDRYTYVTDQTSIDISSLQSKIGATLAKGITSIRVKASLSSGYNLSINGKGYYGERTSEKIDVTKLDVVEAEKNIIYGNEGNAFAQKNNSKVKIEFADNWQDMENIKIKINNFIFSGGNFTSTSQSENILGEGDVTSIMNLTKSDNRYILTIDQSYFVNSGKYKVEFSVIGDGYIESDKSNIEIVRLSQISNLTVTDSGEALLKDDNNFVGSLAKYDGDFKYLVMLSLGGKSEVKEVTRDNEFNLVDFAIWEDNYGEYSLQAICYDANNKIIPSSQVFIISGTKIQGIESLTASEEGEIVVVVSDSDNIQFKGRINEVERIIPFVATENLNEYSISILSLAKLFNLEVEGVYDLQLTVKKVGSVEADWEEIRFSIGKQDNFYLVKDSDNITTYLVIQKFDNSTKNFRLNIGGVIKVISSAGIPLLLPIEEGYVNYTLNGDVKTDMFFSKNKEDNYFLCYAMELDKCLDLFGIDYGDFSFDISRISKEDGVIKQHNEQTISLARLNTIQTDLTEAEHLQIQDSMLRFGFTNKTSRKNITTSYLIKFTSESSSFQKIISTRSLDLRDVGLVVGNEYKISVQVLCGDNSVVSSKEAGEIKTIKYSTPLSLEVSGGKLVFNEDDFKESVFAKKIIAFAQGNLSEQDLVDFLDETIFTSPYYFSANGDYIGAKDGKGEIKIIKLNGESLTSQEFKSQVSLIDLIPNISIENCKLSGVNNLFGVIEYLKGNNSSTKTYGVINLLRVLSEANQGIGLNKVLFDDIARDVPVGDYRIEIRHKGGASGNVDSYYSNSSKINVKQAPAITLVYDEDENQYIANIAPQGGITNYILQIRQNATTDPKAYPAIYISKNDESYVATCGEGEIDISSILTEYSNGFGIVLNKLKNVLDEKGLATLSADVQFECDVFANDENSLSKSAKFTLCYHELKGENISYANGTLTIKNHPDLKELLLRYRQLGLKEERVVITGQLKLPAVGEYDYIIISYPGGIVTNNVYIESQRYMIKNIYQLDSPNVITARNQFNISAVQSDLDYLNDIDLKITNNVAKGKNYTFENIGGYENFKESGLYYQPGNSLLGETSSATQYIFNFVGNSASFTIENCSEDKAEFTLTHGTETLVFSSENSSVNARMLSKVQLSLNNGNIEWTPCSDTIDGTILYEVKIEYYSTSSSDTDITQKTSQTLYTTLTNLPTNNFNDNLDNSNYSKYNIIVTPLAGTEQPLEQTDSIKTLEGKYYSINGNSYYQNGSAVLRGESANKEISRSAPVSGVTINIDGKIVFEINSDESFIITAQREGATFEVLGEYEYKTTENDPTTKEVTFTPRTGEANDGLEYGYEYQKISICTYIKTTNDREGTLLSKPASIPNVYKLPEITEDKFEITFVKGSGGYSTMLDLSKFFENKVAEDNECYNVVVAYKISTQTEKQHITLSASEPRVAIDSWTSLEMAAKASTTTDKNLISSTTVEFSITATEIKKKPEGTQLEVIQLGVTFDTTAQRFGWKWIDNRTGEFEYFVELTYVDGNSETIESAIVKDMYYAPIRMGEIKTFKISARQIVDSKNRYTFSELYVIEKENGKFFEVNKFASGKGTKTDPYIIETKTQFLNIASRNDSNNKVYFKLADSLSGLEIKQSDLVNDDGFLIGSFSGVLDGNGKTITFICDRTAKKTLSLKIDSSNTYAFSEGCALFGEISSTGEVKNLTVQTTLQFSSAPNSIVVAPIALVNQGKIENVKLQGFTISQNNVLNKANSLFIGGIVGINKGEISSCTNECELDISADISTFGYGGIALANEKTIEKCVSKQDKSFTFGVITTSYIGGIALSNTSNSSLIRLCGVESSFSISMVKNSTTYGGGIVVIQTIGTINACYFNGEFSNTSSGTLSAGGIVYSATGGDIYNSVSTQETFNAIKMNATIKNCYGTSSNNTLTTLTERTNILSSDSSFSGVTLKISYQTARQRYVATLSY